MNQTLIIWTLHYQVNRRFHPHVPSLLDYLVKTIGVDHDPLKKNTKKQREGKGFGKRMKTSVFHHWLRRAKKKFKKKSHETTKAF
ncbi:MAG TPA: hypothetical protein VNZ49_10495 [Bacteroidia bacterium]|jgi:hypothetical protein|nr:hypothetical protein [Bacteroidia bacterium]